MTRELLKKRGFKKNFEELVGIICQWDSQRQRAFPRNTLVLCPLRKVSRQTWVKLDFLLDSEKSAIARRFQNEQGHPLQRLQGKK